jgi:hypothetical protein
MQQSFTSPYRVNLYGFGHPTCPNLENQAGIWMLLTPGEFGVGYPPPRGSSHSISWLIVTEEMVGGQHRAN